MSLLCSTCSTRPRKNCKKSTKNSKFQKNIQKKPKNPSKNFFSIFPEWHYFNFAISISVFVAIKIHLLKRHFRRYLYFIFIQKTVSMMYPLPSESFHWRLNFQNDDLSELTFNDVILILKIRMPHF